ncbi:MAG: hypothetical protein K9W43_02015 [Candidatus Thorarchaeota archaeon]|nr:hypothetical protein [Candidatus Thorarchaeota archaeon]
MPATPAPLSGILNETLIVSGAILVSRFIVSPLAAVDNRYLTIMVKVIREMWSGVCKILSPVSIHAQVFCGSWQLYISRR